MTASLSIFVVDRDRDVAEGLAEVLSTAGHEVQWAFSGEDATRILTEQSFDVSFINVKLPGMSGIESFLEIHKIRPGMRAIMMTGYTVEQLLTQAVDEGAVRLVRKPFEMDGVLAALDTVRPTGMVLVAEDDPDFSERLETELSNVGQRVAIANTGNEALDAMEAGDKDVLLLDLRLPFMSGLEIFLKLKKRGHSLPTILVSGFVGEMGGPAGLLRDMCVGGILAKPFDPSQLLIALETISEAIAKAPAPQTVPRAPDPEPPEARPQDRPEKEAPKKAEARSPDSAAEPRPGKILVIDDDRDVADGLADVLVFSGHEVRTALTVDEALDAIADFDAEIALVDIQLGRDSGLELIKVLKDRRPNILAVVVTAKADQQSAIDALRSGADDYLNKPLHPNELFQVLQRCFDRIDSHGERANTEVSEDDFAANMSHELRDPLNAVIGFSEILSAEMLGPLGCEQYRDYATDIRKAGEHLTSVIDEMLDKKTPAAADSEDSDAHGETSPDVPEAPEPGGLEPSAMDIPGDQDTGTADESDPLVAAFYAGKTGGPRPTDPGSPSPETEAAEPPEDESRGAGDETAGAADMQADGSEGPRLDLAGEAAAEQGFEAPAADPGSDVQAGADTPPSDLDVLPFPIKNAI